MLKGFKDFVMRGNVIDLAVGVVIGAAFGGVVSQFSESFLQPLINLVGVDASRGAAFPLGDDKNLVQWGKFLSVLISFILTAAVVYFLVVMPMNRLAALRKAGVEPEPAAPSEEVRLLTEIRDALVEGRVPAQSSRAGAQLDEFSKR